MIAIKKYAILVAGGTGTRMNNAIPKQFLPLGNSTILMHTIQVFYNYDHSIEIIIVLPKQYLSYWNDLCKQYKFTIKHNIVIGGDERFYSVKNALALIHQKGLVAIHDAVRPLVSLSTIQRCFSMAQNTGTAVPVITPAESVRVEKNNTTYSLNRNTVKLVQTPQVFNSDILLSAYKQDFKPEFTDDASVIENAGHTIYTVEGNIENIKITTWFEMKIAQTLLEAVK